MCYLPIKHPYCEKILGDSDSLLVHTIGFIFRTVNSHDFFAFYEPVFVDSIGNRSILGKIIAIQRARQLINDICSMARIRCLIIPDLLCLILRHQNEVSKFE